MDCTQDFEVAALHELQNARPRDRVTRGVFCSYPQFLEHRMQRRLVLLSFSINSLGSLVRDQFGQQGEEGIKVKHTRVIDEQERTRKACAPRPKSIPEASVCWATFWLLVHIVCRTYPKGNYSRSNQVHVQNPVLSPNLDGCFYRPFTG